MRLIGEDGEQLGVLATFEALKSARERGVDLVEVAPNAVPPVCRMLDYGRFKYEQEKKDREARKNQKIVLMKEVRLRPKTDDHDIAFKSKQIERFVEDGDRVKVTLRFRGREMAHPGLGRQLLEQVAERVKEVAAVERMPLQEGNTMTMILTRAKAVQAPPAKPVVPGPTPSVGVAPVPPVARPTPAPARAAAPIPPAPATIPAPAAPRRLPPSRRLPLRRRPAHQRPRLRADSASRLLC
ncbi:MAG: translation initiation factor [Chloroflexi bacterium]|nr:translation initiation factor [Chloroflexota bacterium]